jgi:hypothetical protein
MKKILGSALVIYSTTFAVAGESNSVVDTNITKPEKIESVAGQRVYNTGMKLGTLGLGVDLSTPINNALSLRFNLNGASYTDTLEDADNDYDGTLDLLTAGILLDYYPFENNFRLTTGLYYNGNGFNGKVTPTTVTTINIDGVEYTLEDINYVNTDVSFDKVAPYVGLGWGTDAHDKGWGFTFDLGVLYHGEANVDLTADIKNEDLAEIINEGLKAEELNAEDDLNDFQFYPVVMLGVNYSF